MGVRNLWDILESCKKTLPLHHLQNKRVCIDLSCWIVQLHKVCKSHTLGIKDNKVYLRSLFHRLRALLALNCTLILVTDGSIPAIKLSTYRRRLGLGSEVIRDETISHKVSSLRRNTGSEFSCMIKEAKVLAMALGIACLDGMEEAEAQCALLNSESLCDGCFTADSDIFLFGARTVFRDIYLGEGGHVVCYEMADIERNLGFGRNSLIALALLLGSDYSHGVHGLGQETACQIVKSIGDHVVLQRVASEGLTFAKKTKGSKKQGKFPKGDANKENCLDHTQKNSVNGKDPLEDDQFLQVMNAYLKPKCHSPDSEAVHRVLGHYAFQRVQLHQICDHYFGWPPEKTDEYILPKIAERDLRRFTNLRSSSEKLGVQLPLHEMPVKCPVSSIIKPRKMQGRECFEVAWEEFDGLKSSIVPADLIESACPEKIIEFVEMKAQGKKQKENGKARARKPEKKADALSEVDQKLQNLLLDIESENTVVFSADVCREPIVHSAAVPDPVAQSAAVPDPVVHSVAVPEVIDLLSPSPPIRACKISKSQLIVDEQSDVIELESDTKISKSQHIIHQQSNVIELDSETDDSPEHARKARELRSFISSIKFDIF